MKILTLATLGTAALLTLTAAQPAVAKVSSGQAVTACKAEVAARYGKNAKTKLHRIKSGKLTKVSLSVRGVTDKSFKVECKIDGMQQITAFTDSRDDTLAAR